jgi:hypothetical protein
LLLLDDVLSSGNGRHDRNHVADCAVLGQLGFIVANPANLIRRGFEVFIWHQHDLRAAFRFDVIEPFALLVHEIRCDFDRQLSDDFYGAIFASLLADES